MLSDEKPVMAETKRLADVVYERLCESIVDGTLAPGQRVRDGELADRLGVSRMPVREALQRLERQGLIEMVASRYTRVTDVTPEMPAKSLEFIGYQLGIGLHLALPRMSEEERAHASDVAREIAREVATDPRSAYGAYSTLNDYIAEHSGNSVYAATISDSWLHMTRNLRGTFPLVKDAAALTSDFERLADLISSGDAIDAESQVRDTFLLGPGQGGTAHAVAHLWDDAE